MFGSNKPVEDAGATTSTGINTLAKGTTIEGTIHCDSDMRVDGTVKGKLLCKSKLIIGPTGKIEGEVECQNAVVEGAFKGKLKVSELLNVRETAEIDGEIATDKLLVQSGARFNVSCKMEIAAGNGKSEKKELNTGNESSKVAGGKTEVGN